MCFSPAASFALAGALVPLGLYTIATVRNVAPAWLPFAAFPLAFGIQQGVEGVVWLGLLGDDPDLSYASALLYIFFSHALWPAFVPFAVCAIEHDARRKRLMSWLTGVGVVFGLMLYFPILSTPDMPQVAIIDHSILYRTTGPDSIPITEVLLRLAYAAVVVGSLWAASDPRIRFFGSLVAGSLLVTWTAFAYAFVSIWCFFAAMLSVYLAVILLGRDRRWSVRAH